MNSKKLMRTGNARRALMTASMVIAAAVPCFASNPDFEQVTRPIIGLLEAVLGPAIALVGAVGALYCIVLGVKFARAEEPQDREKAKSHLKNAIIGFVLIFVLIVALKLLLPVLTAWASQDFTK